MFSHYHPNGVLVLSLIHISTNEDGYTLNLVVSKVKLVLVLDNVSFCWISLIKNQGCCFGKLFNQLWLCWEIWHCSHEVRCV